MIVQERIQCDEKIERILKDSPVIETTAYRKDISAPMPDSFNS